MNKLSLDASFVPTSRTTTPEGYLCVKGIAARTGVYQYLSSELGLEGPARMVGVYRSPEAVFDEESLSTYAHKDVTNDHPEDLVNSRTYRDHSVGHVQYGQRFNDTEVEVAMIIKDQSAIDDINAGKVELSPGYLAEYVPSSGTDPVTGEPYEFEQRGIVINHVAIVDAARAGNRARIFDQKPKGATMTRKVVLDSKRNLSVTLDDDAAALVQSVIDTKDSEIQAAQQAATDAQTKLAARDAEADKLEEENEELKEKTSDSAISARLAAIVTTVDTARRIVKGFDAKGSTNLLEIKRSCMAEKFPSRDWSAKSESYIEAAFDAEAEKKETEDGDDEDDDKKVTGDAAHTLSQLAKDFGIKPGQFRDSKGTKTSDTVPEYAAFLKGAK